MARYTARARYDQAAITSTKTSLRPEAASALLALDVCQVGDGPDRSTTATYVVDAEADWEASNAALLYAKEYPVAWSLPEEPETLTIREVDPTPLADES
jgi:hypothetical protein